MNGDDANGTHSDDHADKADDRNLSEHEDDEEDEEEEEDGSEHTPRRIQPVIQPMMDHQLAQHYQTYGVHPSLLYPQQDDGHRPTDEEILSQHPNFQEIKEQDRFLPIANINRIMKKSLPANAKISKEAKECVQECVSEYISFITNEASDQCVHEKRKTINGEDLLRAMQNLGFDDYLEPLRLYLQRYRECMKGDKTKTGKRKTPEE
jgi:nuclear transcription Y subunit beta